MLKQIIKFIRLLSSETAPIQISLGIALAMIVGFTPLISLHNVFVVFVLLFFRVNIATFMLALLVFSGLAYLLDPLFHSIGKDLLMNKDWLVLWTELFNHGLWRLTHFNNTVVLGGLVVSLLLFVPVVILSNLIIKKYRSSILVYVEKSSLFRMIKSSKWFSRAVSVVE